MGPEPVIAAQERRLIRKVFLDGLARAAVQKLGMGRNVEIPVEIPRIVQDADVAIRGRLPFDECSLCE